MGKPFRLLRYDWPLHLVLFFTNWLPDNVVFLRLRGWLARPFFGKCGVDLRLARNLTFYNPSQMELGKNIYIAYGCWLNAGEKIYIGDEVIFGPYCVVSSSDHTRHHGSFRYGEPKREPIRIGKGSWIASHVIVTAGSEIGAGSIIAAGAVVKGKIPSDALAAGLPARVVGELSNV
ncbi:MAG: acyltransferase [Desulfobacca sp.]|nr:acyltransferase [Desulfobacca sp.]